MSASGMFRWIIPENAIIFVVTIASIVERLDVDAGAHATSGEVETQAWAPEVRSIDWPSAVNFSSAMRSRMADQASSTLAK
jgi:hypothetical protein